jgi:hypothetical protein
MSKGKPWEAFEAYVARVFGLRQTIASGSKFYDPGDAVGDRHDVFPLWADAKCTEAKSFSLKARELADWTGRAQESGRRFILPLRFHSVVGRHADYVVVGLEDFSELLELAKAHHRLLKQSVVPSKRGCLNCSHPEHMGACGYILSEDVHDTVGLGGPCTGETFTLATGICKCGLKKGI